MSMSLMLLLVIINNHKDKSLYATLHIHKNEFFNTKINIAGKKVEPWR